MDYLVQEGTGKLRKVNSLLSSTKMSLSLMSQWWRLLGNVHQLIFTKLWSVWEFADQANEPLS